MAYKVPRPKGRLSSSKFFTKSMSRVRSARKKPEDEDDSSSGSDIWSDDDFCFDMQDGEEEGEGEDTQQQAFWVRCASSKTRFKSEAESVMQLQKQQGGPKSILATFASNITHETLDSPRIDFNEDDKFRAVRCFKQTLMRRPSAIDVVQDYVDERDLDEMAARTGIKNRPSSASMNSPRRLQPLSEAKTLETKSHQLVTTDDDLFGGATAAPAPTRGRGRRTSAVTVISDSGPASQGKGLAVRSGPPPTRYTSLAETFGFQSVPNKHVPQSVSVLLRGDTTGEDTLCVKQMDMKKGATYQSPLKGTKPDASFVSLVDMILPRNLPPEKNLDIALRDGVTGYQYNYLSLHAAVRACAVSLAGKKMAMEKGDRVVMVMSLHPETIIFYYACLVIGAVPVLVDYDTTYLEIESIITATKACYAYIPKNMSQRTINLKTNKKLWAIVVFDDLEWKNNRARKNLLDSWDTISKDTGVVSTSEQWSRVYRADGDEEDKPKKEQRGFVDFKTLLDRDGLTPLIAVREMSEICAITVDVSPEGEIVLNNITHLQAMHNIEQIKLFFSPYKPFKRKELGPETVLFAEPLHSAHAMHMLHYHLLMGNSIVTVSMPDPSLIHDAIVQASPTSLVLSNPGCLRQYLGFIEKSSSSSLSGLLVLDYILALDNQDIKVLSGLVNKLECNVVRGLTLGRSLIASLGWCVSHNLMSVGIPLSNYSIRVIEEEMMAADAGKVGEIFFRSDVMLEVPGDSSFKKKDGSKEVHKVRHMGLTVDEYKDISTGQLGYVDHNTVITLVDEGRTSAGLMALGQTNMPSSAALRHKVELSRWLVILEKWSNRFSPFSVPEWEERYVCRLSLSNALLKKYTQLVNQHYEKSKGDTRLETEGKMFIGTLQNIHADDTKFMKGCQEIMDRKSFEQGKGVASHISSQMSMHPAFPDSQVSLGDFS